MFIGPTVKIGYKELGCERKLGKLVQIGHFTTQIDPVITNPGYNEQKRKVPSCSL